jgi:hypothetical protein
MTNDCVMHAVQVLKREFPGHRVLVMNEVFALGVLDNQSDIPMFLHGGSDEW